MMRDDDAEDLLLAVQHLALIVRDEGPDARLAAARNVLMVAGGDAVAALIVAAAQIDPDRPVDPWWAEYADTEPIRAGIDEDVTGIDLVAVDRIAGGARDLKAHPAERDAAITRLDEHKMNATQIAARLGCTTRTVVRARAKRREAAA